MIDPESAKRAFLDYGWDADERRRIAELMRLVDEDEGLRRTLQEYDDVRALLAPVDMNMTTLDGGGPPSKTAFSRARERGWGGRARAVVLAASITLIVVLGSSRFFQSANDSTAPSFGDREWVVHSEPLTSRDVQAHAAMFREVDSVFDERAGWVLVANGESELGLSSKPIDSHSEMVVVRAQLFDRQGSLSVLDFVLLPGQVVDTTIPVKGDRLLKCRLATLQNEPAKLSCRIELGASESPEIGTAALATVLPIGDGEPHLAGTLTIMSEEYRVLVSSVQTTERSE